LSVLEKSLKKSRLVEIEKHFGDAFLCGLSNGKNEFICRQIKVFMTPTHFY